MTPNWFNAWRKGNLDMSSNIGSGSNKMTVGLASSPISEDDLLKRIQDLSYKQGVISVSPNSPDFAAVSNTKKVICTVEKVENGFIFEMGGTRYVAADADALKDIFITALVAKKLENR